MKLEKKCKLRQSRIWRIRKKIQGTQQRPRLCVHFSNKHIYAQAIDDETGNTLVALTTQHKELRECKLSANVQSASEMGKLFAEKAKKNKITQVIFDRNGRLYHGTVKAFAQSSRQAGLIF